MLQFIKIKQTYPHLQPQSKVPAEKLEARKEFFSNTVKPWWTTRIL